MTQLPTSAARPPSTSPTAATPSGPRGGSGRHGGRGAARRRRRAGGALGHRADRAAGQGDADRQHDQAAAGGGAGGAAGRGGRGPAARDPPRSIVELEEGLAPELGDGAGAALAAVPRTRRRARRSCGSPRPSWSAGWRGCSTASRRPWSPSRWRRGCSWSRCAAAGPAGRPRRLPSRRRRDGEPGEDSAPRVHGAGSTSRARPACAVALDSSGTAGKPVRSSHWIGEVVRGPARRRRRRRPAPASTTAASTSGWALRTATTCRPRRASAGRWACRRTRPRRPRRCPARSHNRGQRRRLGHAGRGDLEQPGLRRVRQLGDVADDLAGRGEQRVGVQLLVAGQQLDDRCAAVDVVDAGDRTRRLPDVPARLVRGSWANPSSVSTAKRDVRQRSRAGAARRPRPTSTESGKCSTTCSLCRS